MTEQVDANAWRRHYDDRAVVEEYARDQALQPPEATILQEAGAGWRAARLLDIGVGAGRTARHLIPLCREYVGADYAESMIAECRRSFASEIESRGARFEVADARALPFADGSFDVVVFSFNGIDNVPTADRVLVLRECRRVLRGGGSFVFSSHNLLWLARFSNVRWRGSFGMWREELRFWTRMRRLNREAWPIDGKPALELRDADGDFSTYYARPQETARQVRAEGFTSVRAFDLSGGEVALQDLPGRIDPWIYFLCEAGPAAS